MIGVSTGGRISELLSLRVADVYQNGRPVTDLIYNKNIVKLVNLLIYSSFFLFTDLPITSSIALSNASLRAS